MITLRDQLTLAGWNGWTLNESMYFLCNMGENFESPAIRENLPEGMFQPLIFRGLNLWLLFVTVMFF